MQAIHDLGIEPDFCAYFRPARLLGSSGVLLCKAGSTLEGDQGTDVHEDEEQYQDQDDHHYKVGPAHI